MLGKHNSVFRNPIAQLAHFCENRLDVLARLFKPRYVRAHFVLLGFECFALADYLAAFVVECEYAVKIGIAPALCERGGDFGGIAAYKVNIYHIGFLELFSICLYIIPQ